MVAVFFTVLVRTLFYNVDDSLCPYCGKEAKAAIEKEVNSDEIKTMMLRHIDSQKLTKKTSKGTLEKENIIALQNILVYFVTRTMLPHN